MGDIINSLPLIKEISKSKKCNLYIEINKLIPSHVQNRDHPFGKYYLTETSAKKILPLLDKQKYINKVSFFNKEEIDVNLNLFRELPIIIELIIIIKILYIHAKILGILILSLKNEKLEDR